MGSPKKIQEVAIRSSSSRRAAVNVLRVEEAKDAGGVIHKDMEAKVNKMKRYLLSLIRGPGSSLQLHMKEPIKNWFSGSPKNGTDPPGLCRSGGILTYLQLWNIGLVKILETANNEVRVCVCTRALKKSMLATNMCHVHKIGAKSNI